MRKLVLGLFAVLCMSVAAHAGTSTTFVLVANGLYDSAGDGNNTYAMRVTADTDWTNADLSVALNTGSLGHVAPPFLGSANAVNGFGDTAGHAPTLANGDLTGGFNGVYGPAGTHVEDGQNLSTSWFTTETNDIGTFDIAMVTVSPDANGTILFRTISGSAVENGGFTGAIGDPAKFVITDGSIVVIPEPASLVLAGLGLIGVAIRRRR